MLAVLHLKLRSELQLVRLETPVERARGRLVEGSVSKYLSIHRSRRSSRFSLGNREFLAEQPVLFAGFGRQLLAEAEQMRLQPLRARVGARSTAVCALCDATVVAVVARADVKVPPRGLHQVRRRLQIRLCGGWQRERVRDNISVFTTRVEY